VSCPQLRELSLSDCPQITDHGLWQLARLGPSLRCRYSRLNFQFDLMMKKNSGIFQSQNVPKSQTKASTRFDQQILQFEPLTMSSNCPGVDTLLQASLPQPAWLPPHNRRQPGQPGGQLLQAALLGPRQVLRHRLRPGRPRPLPPGSSKALSARLSQGGRGWPACPGRLLPRPAAAQRGRGGRSVQSCAQRCRHPLQKLFHRDLK